MNEIHDIPIPIPDLCLVFLVGPSGSGKSTFAQKHFRPTEILSSDYFRALIADDENDQTVTGDAFKILHLVVEKRLQKGRRTVIDATNLMAANRAPFHKLARKYHVESMAIVFNLEEDQCLKWNASRENRFVDPFVIKKHFYQLQNSLIWIKKEQFSNIYVLNSDTEVRRAKVRCEAVACDKKWDKGPFDIIGDVHGCYDELVLLLKHLAYILQKDNRDNGPKWTCHHPEQRKPVFLGDLTGEGPGNLDTLDLVSDLVMNGKAYCVRGDSEWELMKVFNMAGAGKGIQEDPRSSLSSLSIERLSDELRNRGGEYISKLKEFLCLIQSHYILDEGRLITVHGGITPELFGRSSPYVDAFCLFGESSGKAAGMTEYVRFDWVEKYSGKARIVYGHVPIREPVWYHRTVNIDTGCPHGGCLTAVRYPERKFVSVEARSSVF